MADGVWVCPHVFGHSKQLLLNKFFDLSTPSMRKVDDGEKKKKRKIKKRKKIMMFIVATTSLPVDHPNANRLERRMLVPIVLYSKVLYGTLLNCTVLYYVVQYVQ